MEGIMLYQSFEDIEVWKRSVKLSTEVYKKLLELRDYGFKDQITRSSLSIPSNIAEGFERRTQKEYLNFLSYSKGSCGELRTQIYIGINTGYIQQETGKAWIDEARQISMMLSGLMKKIRKDV